MIGTKIKIMALSIAAMISLLGLGGAAAASGLTDLTLFVNEHVSLSASPGTTGGSYYYMWTPSWAISENGAALTGEGFDLVSNSSALNSCANIFNIYSRFGTNTTSI